MCEHSSEQLQTAVALDKLCSQFSLTTPDQQAATERASLRLVDDCYCPPLLSGGLGTGVLTCSHNPNDLPETRVSLSSILVH